MSGHSSSQNKDKQVENSLNRGLALATVFVIGLMLIGYGWEGRQPPPSPKPKSQQKLDNESRKKPTEKSDKNSTVNPELVQTKVTEKKQVVVKETVATKKAYATSCSVKAVRVVSDHAKKVYTAKGSSDFIGLLPPNFPLEYVGENGRYYEVQVYTAGPRYILKDGCEVYQASVNLPTTWLSKSLYDKLGKIDDRASIEANEMYPSLRPTKSEFQAEIEYENILQDKYALSTFLDSGISPIAIRLISSQGDTEEWWVGQ